MEVNMEYIHFYMNPLLLISDDGESSYFSEDVSPIIGNNNDSSCFLHLYMLKVHL